MQLCYFTNTSQVRHQIKCRFFEVKPWNSEVLVIAVLSFWYIVRSLKQRCFWVMDVNQKCGLFPFDMPWRYHICIAKCLYSYRDYLPENLDKTTIGSLASTTKETTTMNFSVKGLGRECRSLWENSRVKVMI